MKKENFFMGLLNSSAETSSKRFISLTTLCLFFVVVIYSVFFSKTIDANIIYALVSLILGSSVMTLAQKSRTVTVNRDDTVNRNDTYKENVNNNDEVIN